MAIGGARRGNSTMRLGNAMMMLLIAFAVKIILVHAELKDFISLDCGAAGGYVDAKTHIQYVQDSVFIQTGIIKEIDASYKTNSLEQQFHFVRSFPEGTKNCYALTPYLVNGSDYLVRARFMYGNYDLKNQLPQFDLYVGVNFWTSVRFDNESSVVTKEIVNVSSSNLAYVCLVNTDLGIPFISVLELRKLNSSVYPTEYGSLELHSRWDMGSQFNQYRYPDDVYDRIWEPFINWDSEVAYLITNQTIDADPSNAIDSPPPPIVMSTAVTPNISNGFIDFHWKPDNPDDQYYLYFYFAEFQKMQANQSRKLKIYLNNITWYNHSEVPTYLFTDKIYDIEGESWDWFNISIRPTSNSTLPPILNAFEAFTVRNLTLVGTNQVDDDALESIKRTYAVKKNWQGDPCVPKNFSWEGVHCSNDGYKPNDSPRITFLDLSSSGLSGEISRDISELTSLEFLDMSNNSLTGSVPDFFSHMTSLRNLNLSGNQLTGNVPTALLERRNTNLTLSLENNRGLCISDTCNNTDLGTNKNGTKSQNGTNRQNRTIVIAVVTSVLGVLILVAVLAAVLWRVKQRKQTGGNDREVNVETSTGEHADTMETVERNKNEHYSVLKSGNQRFAYGDVLSITNNFERAIGKGGFGTVYYGCIDDTRVAVKMLSSSSIQGYRQFHAEAKLLMRVHHRNLTSLVGFCEEGDKLGLLYEYMAKGDLHTHLSAKNPRYLSWETRLNIALDAAKGLEYLHDGCKPPIIHRDVKSTNILLNESFQAKLSDFGLSRIFPTESNAGVSSTVVGTPGYLDPEYYSSHLLSEKSDVYGYGVVLLEIITGQPPIAKNDEKTHIIETVKTVLASSGDITLVVDPRLREDFDISSAWKAVEVAMACVSSPSTRRPNMNQIVNELQQCSAMEKARTSDSHPGTEVMNSAEEKSLYITTGTSPLAR